MTDPITFTFKADVTGDKIPEDVFIEMTEAQLKNLKINWKHSAPVKYVESYDPRVVKPVQAYYVNEGGEKTAANIKIGADVIEGHNGQGFTWHSKPNALVAWADAQVIGEKTDGVNDTIWLNYDPNTGTTSSRIDVPTKSSDGQKLWTEYERANDLFPGDGEVTTPAGDRDYSDGRYDANELSWGQWFKLFLPDCMGGVGGYLRVVNYQWEQRDTQPYILEPEIGVPYPHTSVHGSRSSARFHDDSFPSDGPYTISVIPKSNE